MQHAEKYLANSWFARQLFGWNKMQKYEELKIKTDFDVKQWFYQKIRDNELQMAEYSSISLSFT